MLILIDNYDSFTYNLLQYFQVLNQEVKVVYNDELSLIELKALKPEFIVISPGPKAPDQAGISLSVIKHFFQKIPILGICLGHQCLAQAFGGKIISAPEILHGKTSAIYHRNQGLFENLPSPFQAMRYHSLAVDFETLPNDFRIDAWTSDTIMGIAHQYYPLFGLQFHPESILSEHGLPLLERFLRVKTWWKKAVRQADELLAV